MFASHAWADENKIDFEAKIRPLLKARCVECHGADSQHNGLRLDAKKFAMQGGDSGPVILPGKSSESELIHRITSESEFEVMPPEGEKLTEQE
ncbi:MAG: c-type cytochrome domain-containing protein, partial [Pirellulaceae bacterium]